LAGHRTVQKISTPRIIPLATPSRANGALAFAFLLLVDLVRLSDRLVPRRHCASCLFPALQFHRFFCRRSRRLLLASTVTFSENDSLPDCLDDESFVMFMSGL